MTKNPFGQLGKKLLLLTLLLVTLSISALAADNNYLTFQSEDGQSFTLKMSNKPSWTNMEYSNDGGANWMTWTASSATTPINSSATGTLYLRGTGNTVITGPSEVQFVFGGESKKIACTGNIMTLLDYENPNNATMGEQCFHILFRDCSVLTSAPQLPATKLATGCYKGMFSSCSALTSAPQLPATTLANNCYDSMFSACTALTSAPEKLPATTLANYCYIYMFYGCISLTSAPQLPATTLASDCYFWMFRDCKALTSAPELPATTLTNNCYSGMFNGCSALTSAPELPATTLASDCYKNMFRNCTSLTSAPQLPATTLANYCYNGMFYGCSNLQVSTTEPTNSNYVVWNFPSTSASSWSTAMLTGTGGNFTNHPKTGSTYYVTGDVDAVCFEGYTVSEILGKCIQFTFSDEIEHPADETQKVTTLTTKQTVAKLFPQLQDLSGKISFGVTVKGLSNGIHVTGVEFVAPEN